MSPKAKYLLQIFEKIGAPLLHAVGSAPPSADAPEKQLETDTQQAATLLAKAVQLSIDLGKMASIETASESDADTLRVALAALAGPMVAAQYKQLGRTPNEQDLARITGALDAVLTFSENFAGDNAHSEALENMSAAGQVVSAHQTNIQYLHLFIPVIEAVGKFAFGQQGKTLMRDIAGRLTNEAKLMRTALFGDVQDASEQKRIELGLLRALADIYAGAHERAIVKAASDANAASDIKVVWDDFENQLSMLQIIGENLSPAGASSASSVAPAPSSPIPTAPPPLSAPPEAATPPATPPPSQAPAAPPPPIAPAAETPPASPPAGGGGPMSFFANKPSDEPAAPPAEAPPATPPAAPETPATPPSPPPTETPQAPPAAPPPSDGGSPMSFFTKKDDDGDNTGEGA